MACNEYSNCSPNARCVFRNSGRYECECNPGFVGDGYKCSTQACDILNDCGENALCEPDTFTRQYRCRCENGYAGNGYQCFKDGKIITIKTGVILFITLKIFGFIFYYKSVKSCDILQNCHQNAECLYSDRQGIHVCQCRPGFSGDGHHCSPISKLLWSIYIKILSGPINGSPLVLIAT